MTLRELRAHRQLTLRTVSEQTGIAIPHLSELERGIRLATPAQLERLSEALAVDPEGWRLLYVTAQEAA